MANSFTIDRKQLLKEISSVEPTLVKVAKEVLVETVFNPAVAAMKYQFEEHPVTQELKGGIGSQNISKTIIGDFREDSDKGDSPPNLFSFIGFDSDSNPTESIEKHLDPSDSAGPKITYKGKNSDNTSFNFLISAPNTEVIYRETPLPWAPGISWAQRIEQGLPGVGQFLNTILKRGSHSGGGIQVQNKLRTGTYRATSYLTAIFNNFLKSFSGK